MGSTMSKAAFGFLWCFVLVLSWDVFTQVPMLGSIPRVVGVAASAVGVLHILAGRRLRPVTWFHVFAVLFVLWAGVSSFWSIDPEETRTRFLTYVQLVVLVWLIWEIAWTPERQRSLLQAYVLGVCVAAVTTIHNYLSGVTVTLQTDAPRFAALNQNPNELGLILALGLPMAWYLGLSQPDRRFAWLWPGYLPLAITAILLTASRGAFLSMLVALLIIPWTQGRLRPQAKVALYTLVIGSLVVASHFVPETTLERLRSTEADIAVGRFGGRGAIWMAGLEVARDHPLAGVGAGAFGAAVEPALHWEWSAHQVLLTILVEDGIVGLGFFLAMVAAAALPVRQLPLLARRVSVVLLLTLMVGSLSISWDNRKQFWFILGVLATQVAQLRRVHRVAPTEAGRLSSARGPAEGSARGLSPLA